MREHLLEVIPGSLSPDKAASHKTVSIYISLHVNSNCRNLKPTEVGRSRAELQMTAKLPSRGRQVLKGAQESGHW